MPQTTQDHKRKREKKPEAFVSHLPGSRVRPDRTASVASFTARPTFPRQHVPSGFVASQAHRPAWTSALIRSTTVDRPVLRISSSIEAGV